VNNPHLLLLFGLGTLVITGFAIFIIISTIIQQQRQFHAQLEQQSLAFDYQQTLTRSRLEVQESTLNTVSRELHDNVNAILTGGAMQIRIAESMMHTDDGKMILNDALESINTGINSIRELSHNMHSCFLSDIGLAEAIRRELERITRFSDIKYDLKVVGKVEPIEEHQILIYRACQEILQNVLKHAQANFIHVQIDGSRDKYSISICDNGVGFEVGSLPKKSFGLQGIQERLSLAKGSSEICSKPGEGTTITLSIPLDSIIA
jgi:signal transduction histidine kinase